MFAQARQGNVCFVSQLFQLYNDFCICSYDVLYVFAYFTCMFVGLALGRLASAYFCIRCCCATASASPACAIYYMFKPYFCLFYAVTCIASLWAFADRLFALFLAFGELH